MRRMTETSCDVFAGEVALVLDAADRQILAMGLMELLMDNFKGPSRQRSRVEDMLPQIRKVVLATPVTISEQTLTEIVDRLEVLVEDEGPPEQDADLKH